MGRVVCWFSCGAASAVATKLVLGERHADVVVVYTDTGSEHEDNPRFLADCQEWFGVEIVTIRSEKYESTWDVWRKRRFLVGPDGALCTAELKKKPRFAFERPDDVQVFGYTIDPKDTARAERFREQNLGVILRTPLIERGLTKGDCLALLEREGIKLPAMYDLGYRNNNCVGCCKGGMGYWNKIRVDFPDKFQAMIEMEQDLGATVLRDGDDPLPLTELAPDRGNYAAETIECSLFCAATEFGGNDE